MNFPGFYGNEQLKQNLSAAIDRGQASHFYLISGPAGSGKRTLARLLFQALMCRSEGSKPCGTCSQCRKVLNGTHPDIYTVTDAEHQVIAVDAARNARTDLFIRPNEGARKIYYVPTNQEMNAASQNALLKVLEEPPAYGVFVILSENPDQLLPTVRSRCVELKMRPLEKSLLQARLQEEFPDKTPQELDAAIRRGGGWLGKTRELLSESGGWLPQSRSFAVAYGKQDRLALLELLVSMEKLKRDQLIPILKQWQELLTAALLCREGLPSPDSVSNTLAESRTALALNQGIQTLSRAVVLLQGNVSPGAICGNLVWQLS